MKAPNKMKAANGVYFNTLKGSNKRRNMGGFRRAGLARHVAPVTIYRGLAAVVALENTQSVA